MFEQLVESAERKRKDRRWRYFLITAMVWVLALSGIVAGGVLAYDAKLDGQFELICKLVTPPPPVRRGGEAPHKARDSRPSVTSPWTNPPRNPPIGIQRQLDVPDVLHVDIGLETGRGRGGTGSGAPGIPDGIPYGVQPVGDVDPAPTPRPAAKPRVEEAVATNRPLRVSTGPLQGQAIKRVEPPYPPLAKLTHVYGAVSVEIVVNELGNVISARALSGHALLKEAAENAASGWKWKPTMLNGVAVQVIGSITFNFTLQ